MKKTITLLMAIAMILTLSASIFAEPFANNTANTNVNLTVKVDNISATVPLTLAVQAPIGGGSCTTPTDYNITNTSRIGIKVVEIEVEDKLVTPLSYKDGTVTATAADQNKITMQLQPDGGTVLPLTKASAIVEASLGDFVIPADDLDTTGTNEGILPIAVTAQNGPLTFSDAKNQIFVIKYTIEVQ